MLEMNTQAAIGQAVIKVSKSLIFYLHKYLL